MSNEYPKHYEKLWHYMCWRNLTRILLVFIIQNYTGLTLKRFRIYSKHKHAAKGHYIHKVVALVQFW